MGRPKSTTLTTAEMELLTTMEGDMTIRDMSDVLRDRGRTLAYTSVATIARIMVDKGFLVLVDDRRPQKFRATIGREEAQRDAMADVVKRLFAGNVNAAKKALNAVAIK